MIRFSDIRSAFQFYLAGRTIYDIHSPLLFQIIEAKRQRNNTAIWEPIEAIRREYLNDKNVIEFSDLGATSRVLHTKQRTVAGITRVSVSPPAQCRFMANLAARFTAKSILELGTSLGISTAYLSVGNPKAQIETIEGDPSSYALANALFDRLNCSNIESYNLPFAKYISGLPKEKSFDIVFIDGHHTSEATLQYFDALESHFTEGTIIIIDDNHWSPDMEIAWETLKSKSKVLYSVDFFRYGLLIWGTKTQASQSFSYIPFACKPWRIGLFDQRS